MSEGVNLLFCFAQGFLVTSNVVQPVFGRHLSTLNVLQVAEREKHRKTWHVGRVHVGQDVVTIAILLVARNQDVELLERTRLSKREKSGVYGRGTYFALVESAGLGVATEQEQGHTSHSVESALRDTHHEALQANRVGKCQIIIMVEDLVGLIVYLAVDTEQFQRRRRTARGMPL